MSRQLEETTAAVGNLVAKVKAAEDVVPYVIAKEGGVSDAGIARLNSMASRVHRALANRNKYGGAVIRLTVCNAST